MRNIWDSLRIGEDGYPKMPGLAPGACTRAFGCRKALNHCGFRRLYPMTGVSTKPHPRCQDGFHSSAGTQRMHASIETHMSPPCLRIPPTTASRKRRLDMKVGSYLRNASILSIAAKAR